MIKIIKIPTPMIFQTRNSRKTLARLCSVLITALLATSFASQALAAASFPDVPENTVNFGAVEYLKDKGVISGYPDGTFMPDKTINRAEALKIVLLASGKTGEPSGTLPFKDVKTDDWFYPYVSKGYELQIVKGYEDGTFKPASNINLAESLKMILLSFGETLPATVDTAPYPDVGKDLWYAPYAALCKSKQLTWPFDDGNLHAEREITRGEFAQIIYRLMYIREKNLEKFPLSTDWPTYINSSDHYAVKSPFDWQVIQAGQQTVFWKQDTGDGQVSFGRIYPNSATVVAAIHKNEAAVTFDEFLNGLKYYTEGVTQKMTLNNYPFAVINFTGQNRFDYYFELPDKTFLALYTDVGGGANSQYLLEEIRNMVGSLRYTLEASQTDRDKLLAQVRAKILVKEAGQEALGLFKEIILIETDTIGIGTGPIDYYYSAEYDVTLKFERDSNTLLQIHDGRTTAF
jgi:hypothetical protein